MKATGIVRRIDDLGRVTIPIELRRSMGISTDDPLEIMVHEDGVVFRPYRPGCVFCSEVTDLQDFEGQKVCVKCREALAATLGGK